MGAHSLWGARPMPKVTAMDMLSMSKGEGDVHRFSLTCFDSCSDMPLAWRLQSLDLSENNLAGSQLEPFISNMPGAGRAVQVMLRQLEILRLSLCGCPSHGRADPIESLVES